MGHNVMKKGQKPKIAILSQGEFTVANSASNCEQTRCAVKKSGTSLVGAKILNQVSEPTFLHPAGPTHSSP